jgi:peptidoglycan/xylan/chitin deacetylase (PgdA/CDA1 family)
MTNRRVFLAGLAAFGALGARNAETPEVAITMDDFAWQTIPEPWRANASDTLLNHLRKHRLQAAIFIAGKRVDNPTGLSIVKQWRDQGHWIGNHTYSHQGIDSMGLAPFEADVLRNQRLLANLLTTPRYFRFPMLKEGGASETRDGMRAFLQQNGYRNGAVTIDASDWYYSQRLSDRLNADPKFDWQRYRQPYLNHIANRARYYDLLASQLLNRKIRHTLLIHYNLINVLFLGDLLTRFQEMQWRLVHASYAYADPIFEQTPQTLPAGESLVWALAKQSGRFEKTLRYPGEDDVYEKPLIDALKI